MKVKKISDIAGLETLQNQWNELLARSGGDTIALTWEWLHTWWLVFGEGRELYVLVVYDDGTVVGIAPLLRRSVRHFGMSYRRLEFLASGEDERDEICSEYLDFIIEKGKEEAVLGAIQRYLTAHRQEWDEIVLTKMRADASAAKLPGLCNSAHIHCQAAGDGHTTYVPLPKDWETIEKSLGKSFRQNLRNLRSRCDKDGAQFEVIETEAGFDRAFDNLMRLHQERWTQRGEPGVFSSEKFTRFHRELCRLLLPKKQVRLFQLSFHGEAIASLYTFVYEGEISNYQNGLSPTSRASYSPGTVLLSHAIEHSINSRQRVWDFLGGSDDYKSRWNCQQRELVSLRLAWRTPRETWCRLMGLGVQSLRNIKRRLRRSSPSPADTANP